MIFSKNYVGSHIVLMCGCLIFQGAHHLPMLIWIGTRKFSYKKNLIKGVNYVSDSSTSCRHFAAKKQKELVF